jgi:Tfp pilus assembly protein PilF
LVWFGVHQCPELVLSGTEPADRLWRRQKAVEYLKQGLAINPDGIDANFFYGDYLYRNGDLQGAEQYLRKALPAPARTGESWPTRAGAGKSGSCSTRLRRRANNAG